MSVKRFAVGSAATAVRAMAKKTPRGSAFRFTLSELATVRFTLTRSLPGRRAKGSKRCVARVPAGKRSTRCTREIAAGLVTREGVAAGKTSTAFSGRVGTKPLAAGKYKVAITATDAAGNTSAAQSVTFTVVKKR